VSLDSIIFADGSVLGPDRLGVIGIEQAKYAAEGDFLRALNDTTMSDADLTTWLNQVATAPVNQAATGRPDPVQAFRHAYASGLIEFLKQRGRTAAAQWYTGAHENEVPASTKLHRVQ
jgi:hypothetical protein